MSSLSSSSLQVYNLCSQKSFVSTTSGTKTRLDKNPTRREMRGRSNRRLNELIWRCKRHHICTFHIDIHAFTVVGRPEAPGPPRRRARDTYKMCSEKDGTRGTGGGTEGEMQSRQEARKTRRKKVHFSVSCAHEGGGKGISGVMTFGAVVFLY